MLGTGAGLGGGGGLFGQQTPQMGLGGGFGGLGGPSGLGGGLGTGTSGGLFGNKQGGVLFGTGGGTQGGLTGGGLFGQTPQGQAQGAGLFGKTGGLGTGTGGLFQTPQVGMGQKTLFGQTPTVGGGTTGGLFNQQQQQQTPLFGRQMGMPGGLGAGGGLFAGGGAGGLTGALGATQTQGTMHKFEPTKSTDTVIKNGATQQVNTHLQCISAMKVYEDKSLEELRAEDYASGRKGPQGGGVLGGGLFGQTGQQTSTGGLGIGGGLFQQPKGLGGVLGAGGGLFSQQQGGGGLFSQQKTGGLFSTPASKGLAGGLGLGAGGLGTGGGLFAQQQTSQAGGLFQQQPGGLFSGQTGGGLGGLGGLGGQQQQLGGGLFAQKPGGLGTGGLGTGLGGLGGGTSLGGGLSMGWPQASQAGGLGGGMFNKGLSGGLGQAGGLGAGLGLGQAGQLGGGLGLVGGLGTTGLGGGVLGAGGLGGGLGGLGKLGTGGLTTSGAGLQLGISQLGTGIGQGNVGQDALQALTAQHQKQQLQQQLEILANSPFGDSPLFRGAISDAAKQQQKSKIGTSPVVSKAALTHTPHYKLTMRPTTKLKAVSLSSPSLQKDKSQLFEGLEGSGADRGETFVPRRSVKKLVIKPKPTQPLPDSTTLPLAEVHSSPHSIPVSTTDPVLSTSLLASGDSADSVTPSYPQAFEVTPLEGMGTPAGGGAHDESVDSPELVLGTSYTNPVKKPVPVRPPSADTSTTLSSSRPLWPSPSKRGDTSFSPSPGRLTRDPLRSSLQEEEEDEEAEAFFPAASRQRPSGVILERPGYYTVPSLDEIDSLVSDGQCIVEGLTISRRSYGRIHFPGKTDIYGLNLDALVSIGAKEVGVYPDDTHKPPVGEGLNKRAIVTLEGNWPICKATREPIKDPERLEKMNYVEKLRRSTARIGATFCDYTPETGSCVFEVSHFSKYKLVAEDSDEEEGEEGGSGTTVKRPKTSQADRTKGLDLRGNAPLPQGATTARHLGFTTGQTRSRLEEDEEMSEDDQPSVGVINSDKPRLPPPPVTEHLVSTMGLSTHKMQVMKASFFGTGDSRGPAPNAFTSSKSRHVVSARMPPGHLAPQKGLQNGLSPTLKGDAFHQLHPAHPPISFDSRADSKLEASYLEHSELSSSLYMDSLPVPPHCLKQRTVSAMHAQSALITARHDLKNLVARDKSLVRGKSRLVADSGLFLGRSFRVGWGPNWTLAHSGTSVSPVKSDPTAEVHHQPLFSSPLPASRTRGVQGSSSDLPLCVVIERVDVSTTLSQDGDSSDLGLLYEPYLTAQLGHTDIAASQDGTPRCSPQSGSSLLHAFSDIARQEPGDKGKGDWLTQRQLRLVLQLAVALWGVIGGDFDEDPDSYSHQHARKRAVSRWLMDASSDVIQHEVSNAESSESGYLTSLFSLVTGRQLPAACRLAHAHSDHKLALLLSQSSDGLVSFWELLRQQIKEWEGMRAQVHINPDRLRLYVLLAGVMVWEAVEAYVDVCKGLDWKRTLAVHMWYGCSHTAPISEALREYTQAFQGDDCYATPPLPPYMESSRHQPLLSDSGPFDTCYHLLRLYCHRDHSLELTLCPSSSTSSLLDYRISWHLWAILSTLGYTHIHPTKEAILHTSFACQLEAAGLWHWAVFVLLHLPSPTHLVRELLSRHCDEGEELSTPEVFVIETLHVPASWVYGAKAQRALYLGFHDYQALHLLNAGLWADVHSVIMDHLLSDAIISGETEGLQDILEQLSVPERCAEIKEWDCGGAVYLDFLHISNRLQELEPEDVTLHELEELQLGIEALAHRIGRVPCRTPKERLCQAEVAQRTGAYTKLIASLKSEADLASVKQEVAQCIAKLPMPSDYTLTEYRQLAHTAAASLDI